MRRAATAVAVGAVLAWAAAAPTAHAQSAAVPFDRVRNGPVVQHGSAADALAAERLALAERILKAREEATQREPFGRNFRQHWLDRLSALPVARLEAILAEGPGTNLEDAASPMAADVGIEKLGDTGADMVYTKVTPCRIVDTRVAGGPLGTGASRSFFVAGTTAARFTPQGGAACGIPIGATAVAANVTVVGAAGYGWLRAYPYGGSGNASVINYNGGDTIANGLTLPICDPAVATCTSDLTVVADAYGGHVLVDVMGYFQHVNKADYRTTVTTVTTDQDVSFPTATYQCFSYLSVAVSVPSPGPVVVEARTRLSLRSATENRAVQWGVGTSPTDCDFAEGFESVLADAWIDPPTLNNSTWNWVKMTYTAPAAGTYTFYITGRRLWGAGDHKFLEGGLIARFYPQ